MRLYYSPFACSMAAHIACREAGLDVELVRVDLVSKRTTAGGYLFAENPMGQVPTLVLDDDRTLTENVAVLSYLSDRAPARAGNPPGTAEAYEHTRWLAFVATEIHKKVLWPIFAPATPDAVKEYARASSNRGLSVVASRLAERDTLAGDVFTGADAYLFWALTILPHAGVALYGFPALRRYRDVHRQRPAVRAAVAFEKEQFETPFPA